MPLAVAVHSGFGTQAVSRRIISRRIIWVTKRQLAIEPTIYFGASCFMAIGELVARAVASMTPATPQRNANVRNC